MLSLSSVETWIALERDRKQRDRKQRDRKQRDRKQSPLGQQGVKRTRKHLEFDVLVGRLQTLTLWPLMPGRPGVPGKPLAPCMRKEQTTGWGEMTAGHHIQEIKGMELFSLQMCFFYQYRMWASGTHSEHSGFHVTQPLSSILYFCTHINKYNSGVLCMPSVWKYYNIILLIYNTDV